MFWCAVPSRLSTSLDTVCGGTCISYSIRVASNFVLLVDKSFQDLIARLITGFQINSGQCDQLMN